MGPLQAERKSRADAIRKGGAAMSRAKPMERDGSLLDLTDFPTLVTSSLCPWSKLLRLQVRESGNSMKSRITCAVLFAGLPVVSGCNTGALNPRADKDLDGGVSFAEFDAYMKERIFAEFDGNGDGRVTMEEWRGQNPKGPVANFNKADSNRDGRVSRGESDAKLDRDRSMKKLFKKIDTDGNGRLSAAEITAFEGLMNQQAGDTGIDRLKQATDPS